MKKKLREGDVVVFTEDITSLVKEGDIGVIEAIISDSRVWLNRFGGFFQVSVLHLFKQAKVIGRL